MYYNVNPCGAQSVSLDIGVGENCNVVLTTPGYLKVGDACCFEVAMSPPSFSVTLKST